MQMETGDNPTTGRPAGVLKMQLSFLGSMRHSQRALRGCKEAGVKPCMVANAESLPRCEPGCRKDGPRDPWGG